MSFIPPKKDFINTQDFPRLELDEILKLTTDVKKNPRTYLDSLKGYSLCMMFFNPSTRTRNSFEVGMHQLGGHAVFNDPNSCWLGQKSESVKDTAEVLSRYYSAIGIRMFPNIVNWKYAKCNEELRIFASHAKCSVINFEDDLYHPCQAMTDIFTIKEKLGKTEHKKITISWAYHPKPLPVSVPNSILLASTQFGMDVTLACPPNYELDPVIWKTAEQNSKAMGGTLTLEHDMDKAYDHADVVYVKEWGSLKAYGLPREEKEMRVPYRDKWVCNQAMMDRTAKKSIFMHCLPVRRNIVVTDEVIDGPHSVVYDEAENRMHVQKALMLHLLQQK